MYKTEIIQIGDEVGFIIPDYICKKLDIKAGDIVNITLKDNQIIITPKKKSSEEK